MSEPRQNRDEQRIDKTLEASFPASDPPAWTLGVRDRARRDPAEQSRKSAKYRRQPQVKR